MTAWLIRREFDTDEGKVARWWGFYGFGEPEDAVQFRTKLIAECEYRARFGTLEKCERPQRLTDAFAEVDVPTRLSGTDDAGQRSQDAAPVVVSEVGSVVP